MFPRVDTKNASAVAAWVQRQFASMYGVPSSEWLARVFSEVELLFAGRHPAYGAIDVRYHDLEHTLQATICLTELLQGCQRSADAPKITLRQFELGVASVLLHDTGYLKLRSDQSGTGAKYTFCHVLRSCAFAASYIPTLGADVAAIAAATRGVY